MPSSVKSNDYDSKCYPRDWERLYISHLSFLVVYVIHSREQNQKTIIPGVNWFFGNDVASPVDSDNGVYYTYEFMIQGDLASCNPMSKFKPKVAVLNPTQVEIFLPSLKGAMVSQEKYKYVQRYFDHHNSPVPKSLDIAHNSLFADYENNAEHHMQYRILVDIQTGDRLDNHVFSPGVADGKATPEVVVVQSEHQFFNTNIVVPEVFMSFQIAVDTKRQRYHTAPPKDVVEEAFANLSLRPIPASQPSQPSPVVSQSNQSANYHHQNGPQGMSP